MNRDQAELAFSEWLSQQGFGEHFQFMTSGEFIADGEWYNVDLPGDRPGSKHGSIKLTYGDEIKGAFKSFNGIPVTDWYPGNGAAPSLTDEGRRALAEEAERNAAKKRKAQEAARTKAADLYRRSPAATTDHPYLVRKRIKDVGALKINGEDLLVPIYNSRTDEFQTYQRIKPDGSKSLPKYGVKVGGYARLKQQSRMVSFWEGDAPIVICEGYATAYAIRSSISPRYRVIAALDCGNLKVVAEALHERFPLRPIIIAADNDIDQVEKLGFNPGIRGATEAALAIARKIAVSPPKPDGTSGDFWDLWDAEGDTAVKKLIEEAHEPTAEAVPPPDESPTPPPKQDPPPKQQTQDTKHRNGKSFSLVCAKDIILKPKQWLWEGHLLRGAQELLTGLPGLGKSQVQIGLVACVTAGLPWPNGDKGVSPANVIMMTAEDTLDQEVVPRLLAAGANLDRVHILKYIRSDGKDRQFLLGEDLDALERAVNSIGEVALITIDPITAYMGGKIDSHKTTEVRSQLGPLKDFAERVNVANSTITHPAKSTSQKAIDQFIGSQAFIAAGRIGHVCIEEVKGEENEKTGRILFANAKNNPHTKMPTLAYRITEVIVGQDADTNTNIAAPRVVWEKDVVNITADEAVRAASGTGGGGQKSAEHKAAQDFLREILGKGEPVPVKAIHTAGAAKGFTKNQLRLARERLGCVAVEQIRDGWTWKWEM